MLWMYRNLDSLCGSCFFATWMEWKAFLVVNEESHESCIEHILIYWCWGKLLSCTCTHRGLMEGGYRSGMLAERWRMWCQGCMWSRNCGITKVTILPCPTVSKMPPGGIGLVKMTIVGRFHLSFHLLPLFLSSSLIFSFLVSIAVALNSSGWIIFYPVSFWVLSSRNFPAAQSLFGFPWKSECAMPYSLPEESRSMKWPNSSDNFPWSTAHTEKYLVEK